MKSQIVEHLGQSDILLPSLIAEALAANGCIKVRMSALQAAARHVHQPDHPVSDLQAECRAAGIAPGRHPASPARRLYGLCRALLGDEFVLSPSSSN